MTQPLISVIVPVYNVENYLNKCVDSIVNQTYTNLEIILVDDGSPDNCPKNCDEWAKKDSRIRVIHKENGGLSSARNAGLDIMTGTLVGFVDSDDYIAPNMYEKLYNAMIENDADLSACNYEFFDESGKKLGGSRLSERCITGKQALADIYRTVYSVAYNKLYKHEIFKSLRYTNGYIHEDEIIIHHILGQCNKIIVISDNLYFYVRNNQSIMGKISTGNIQSLYDSFKGRAYTFRDRYNYFMSINRPDLAEKNGTMFEYDVILRIFWRVNFLQYRRDIWPFFLDTSRKLIKTGKFKNCLRIVKLVLAGLRSMFRPFIKEES